MNTSPRAWWNGEKWIVDVKDLMTPLELERCRDFLLNVQSTRLLDVTGYKREECLKTIQALRFQRITQNIVGAGDHVIYAGAKI